MNKLKRIENVIRDFTERGVMIAFGESCTGGFLCHMFTNISGSSNVFERGIVAYSNTAKIEVLGVNREDIEKYGAVSEQVGRQLAENVRKLADVEVGIGVTGIAGPTGGTPEKPVGLVYIGFSTEEGTQVQEHLFKTSRLKFKNRVLEEVLNFLEQF